MPAFVVAVFHNKFVVLDPLGILAIEDGRNHHGGFVLGEGGQGVGRETRLKEHAFLAVRGWLLAVGSGPFILG